MKSKATNSTYMKFSNRRLILNIIRKKPVSRAELSRITGLTRAAVTLIVEELIKNDVLIEIGTAKAKYGRKPVLLDLNPNSYYIVGVSITRDGCNIGIVNIKGILLVESKIILKSNFGVKECLNKIIQNIKKLVDDSKLSNTKFIGIGVSTPGPVDINTGTILNPPDFNIWHNVNVVQELKKNFNLNIYLENNSTSLALAEKNYGRGVEFSSFILIVVDTGIGAGIIINDTLYRGSGGFGSELGHTSVDINGIPCSCGNNGCLELYASIPGVLSDIQKYGQSKQTWNEVVDGALLGNKICSKAVHREARFLSAGIVNVINILELEAVILTGDINYKPQTLLDLIRENVNALLITRDIHKLQILSSSIVENSEVISAAAIIIEKFFSGELQN